MNQSTVTNKEIKNFVEDYYKENKNIQEHCSAYEVLRINILEDGWVSVESRYKLKSENTAWKKSYNVSNKIHFLQLVVFGYRKLNQKIDSMPNHKPKKRIDYIKVKRK